jgi:hypothetical protein
MVYPSSKYIKLSINGNNREATAIENHARILSDDPHFDAMTETKHIWI